LIPGWRKLANATVPEIAFRQWAEYVRAIANARDILPESKYNEVFIDDLQSSPEQVLDQLAVELGLEFSSELKSAMAELGRVNVNSFADTSEDSSMDRNRSEIIGLLPDIAALAPLIGFHVDSGTGDISRTKSRITGSLSG
jgi:hypothetical protein